MAKVRPITRLFVIALLLTTAAWLSRPLTWRPSSSLATGGNIMCDSLGASLGLFLGDSATSLQPLDLLGVQGPAAWPVCNPVFTAGGLKSYDGIAGPTFFQFQNRLFMFYEAISCRTQRRSIGIAESYDDGVTWRGLGSILSSTAQDSLRRPSVFTYNNEIFMLTDSNQGPKLHRCLKFPMSWHLNATLTTDLIRGVSIIKAPVRENSESTEDKWLMVGSIPPSSSSSWSLGSLSSGGQIKNNNYASPQNLNNLGRRGSTLGVQGKETNGIDLPLEDDVLAVYVAPSPLGPWTQLEGSPFQVHAASPGGGLTVLPQTDFLNLNNSQNLDNNSSSGISKVIVRLGRSCINNQCSDVIANKFDFIENGVVEEPLTLPPHQIFLGEKVWRQNDGWDGGQRAGVTMAALPSGKTAAIVLGKPGVHLRPWYAFYLEIIIFLIRCAVVSCGFSLVMMLVLKKGGKNILKRRGHGAAYLHSGSGGGRRGFSTSPVGPIINGSGGGSGKGGSGSSSSLPGGYTPKTSLAIQRLQAEERGEHHQPISPRGRAVLTSRGAARNGDGTTGGGAGTSAGAALAADLAAKFAAFAMPHPSSSSTTSTLEHGEHGNNASLPTVACSAASPKHHQQLSVLNNFRRRRHQLKLALRGAIQRWVVRLLEATPRQILALLSVSLVVSTLAFAVGRVHTVAYPFWAPAPAIEVGGQFSRFTLLVMSYKSRRSLLEGYVRHYQQCPSVGEILIVWNQEQQQQSEQQQEQLENKTSENSENSETSEILENSTVSVSALSLSSAVPDAHRDFPWASVPIRVRSHTNNSLANRYLPDDQLRFRGVLSLDDDLRIPCEDVERAFARWRASPSSLTGFVPRLAEVSSTPRYHTERQAISKGWYNLILTGAAFIDSRTAFPAYWSDSKSMHDARALVEKVHNCDDILMNFVVANGTVFRSSKRGKKQGSVLYVRPSRKLDLSWWSGVGLSHSVNHFLQDAETCLIEFEKIFGRWPLRAEEFDWAESEAQGAGGKPKCSKGTLDCSYLS